MLEKIDTRVLADAVESAVHARRGDAYNRVLAVLGSAVAEGRITEARLNALVVHALARIRDAETWIQAIGDVRLVSRQSNGDRFAGLGQLSLDQVFRRLCNGSSFVHWDSDEERVGSEDTKQRERNGHNGHDEHEMDPRLEDLIADIQE